MPTQGFNIKSLVSKCEPPALMYNFKLLRHYFNAILFIIIATRWIQAQRLGYRWPEGDPPLLAQLLRLDRCPCLRGRLRWRDACVRGQGELAGASRWGTPRWCAPPCVRQQARSRNGFGGARGHVITRSGEYQRPHLEHPSMLRRQPTGTQRRYGVAHQHDQRKGSRHWIVKLRWIVKRRWTVILIHTQRPRIQPEGKVSLCTHRKQIIFLITVSSICYCKRFCVQNLKSNLIIVSRNLFIYKATINWIKS